MLERLQKYLAHCGVASRRKSEELIAGGRVAVNDEIVTELGVKIEPGRDRVSVDGRSVHVEHHAYYLLNKPVGYTTTAEDELGRRTVLDLLAGVPERVYPVGRLDRESEGLLVLTNDGALAFHLTHPSRGVRKTYRVVVEGEVEEAVLRNLVKEGVRLGPVLVKPISASLIRKDKVSSSVEIVVGEGVNREVRRVFAALGHEVKRLLRVRIGPLALKGVGKGKFRPLTRDEVAALRRDMARGTGPQEAEALFPPGSAKSRRPTGKRGRGKPGVRRERMGKPDPAHAGEIRKDREREKRERKARYEAQRKTARASRKSGKPSGPRHPLS